MIPCRVCKNKELNVFLKLGPQPLSNAFLKKEHANDSETYYPLDLCFCPNCFFVQLGYVVDPKVLFSNYMYFSSNSESAKKHYAEFAHSIAAKLQENRGFVVEIASNDGILLKNFLRYKGIKILGIEPAANVALVAKQQGVDTLVDFFCERSAKQMAAGHGRADVIIGTNVFAHVPDLDDFVRGLDALLKDGGVAVFESPYLLDLLEKVEFDTVYHEHCSYISVLPLEYLFNRFGMEIYNIERTPIHGGSIRFFVKRKSDKTHVVLPSVLQLKKLERSFGTDGIRAYDNFSKRVIDLRKELILLLADLKSKDKKIIGYGAAAKGNVLLNYANIGTETLEFIVDKSPHKNGYFTPGKRIPVFGTDKIPESGAEYMLILAWNFSDEIMQEQNEFKKKGGKFIIPVPSPKIV